MELPVLMRVAPVESRAEYAHAVLCLDDTKIVDLIGRDGKHYRVEGYVDGKCPTDVCNCICCRTLNDGEPCEFLNMENLLCSLQEKGGIRSKPIGCVLAPTKQETVDDLNRRHGTAEHQCQLRVVEVPFPPEA